MSEDAVQPLDPRSTYLFLTGEETVSAEEIGDDFWPSVMEGRRQIEGRLMTASDMTADWDHWEMHPKGEEILVLLSGDMQLVFDDGGSETVVTLAPAQAVVVPRGVWHRGIVNAPSRLLAITAGEGTEHRPV